MPANLLPETSLAQLRDIHLPGPLATWPPAPGWFLLAIILIVLSIICGYIAQRFWQKQAPKRAALKRLAELEKQSRQTKNTNYILSELSILLRIVALSYFPRLDCAGLCGNDWLEFLNKTGKTQEFTESIPYLLLYGPYQKNSELELNKVFSICKQWIVSAASHNAH